MKLLLTILILLCSCFATGEASPVSYRSGLTPRYKADELIVRFKDPAKASKSIALQKSTLIRTFKRLPFQHVRLPLGMSVADALPAYRNDPNVLYAEPNYFVRKSVVPNDTDYPSQWNLPLVSAPAAWDTSVGSRSASSVLIAVLDTGIAYFHPDLAANIWTNPGEICGDGIDNDGNGIIDDCYGANFGGFKAGDPWDDDTADSHGTHVAGIIGAVGNNSTGVAGINWAARLMAVKFLHGPEGMGELADALRGVEYALAKGARIINMSFEVDVDSQALRDAVRAVETAGALMVSAAGNTGKNLDTTPVYPASIRSANNIAVAASSPSDGLPGYSDYGRHTVELAAPGGSATGQSSGVLSTVWLGNNGSTLYRTTAGTSMAVPHVTGAAALIWNLNPTLAAPQVKARIMNSVDKLAAFADTTISGGRLNIAKALSSIDLPTVFDVTPYEVPAGGGDITITGTNFGTTRGDVTLAGSPLAVVSWSDTSIRATVPAGGRSGALVVNNQGSGFAVTVLQLQLNLSAMPASGTAPLDVLITATSSPLPTGATYEWDLGDGIFKSIPGSTTSAAASFPASGTYLVRLRVTDTSGLQSIGSVTITVAAPSAGGGGGGGCFIATAAYGSYLHPKVQLLRNFRDTVLMTNPAGRMFVAAYYAASPPLADYIARHDVLRGIARVCLAPLIVCVEYPFLPAAFAVTLCAAVCRRRLKKVI